MDHALLAQAVKSADPKLRQLASSLLKNPLYGFAPRPDRPELYDQQTSFYTDKYAGTACVLSGNGAGKSFCAAAKVAKFLAETPPPEANTPFWVLSQTMEMVTSCCWSQNLKHFIPPEFIDSVQWYRQARGLPKAVVLKKHANGNNYVIELKSYDQSREALQAANIVGFLLDEQCPMSIYREVLARTRKWNYPGSKLVVLTPLSPDPDPENLQHIFEHQEDYPSWKFYRFNTRLNRTLDPNFVRNIEENTVESEAETRLIGSFARFEGAVYSQFDPAIHVCDPIPLETPWLHMRGLDLGWSHGTACVWAAKDPAGRYYVYREYLETHTSVEDHVARINAGWPDVLCKGQTYADPAAAQTLHEFRLRGLSTVSANKDVLAGIATMQTLLRPGPDGRPKLVIFNTCPLLISQMRSYVWDAKRPDKPLKVNDDLCFVAGTLVETDQGRRPIETIRPGDRVLTREGYKRVTASGCTGLHHTYLLRLPGRVLHGTGNHPVWTTKGWKALSVLTPCDTIMDVWNQKQLNGAVLSGDDTQTANGEPTGSTTSIILPQALSTCIEPSGGRRMEKFQKDTKSTTRTTTLSITMLATWKPLPNPNICRYMDEEGNSPRSNGNISPRFGHWQANGTGATKDEPGIALMGRKRGKTVVSRSKHASSAASSTKRLLPLVANTADLIAASVPFASGKSLVYNLTVSECPEYFANGILVHNCDAARYLCHSHRMENSIEVKPLNLPKRTTYSPLNLGNQA